MANRRSRNTENTVPDNQLTTETTENTLTDNQTTPVPDETAPKDTSATTTKRELAAEIPFALVDDPSFEFIPQTRNASGRPRSEYQQGLDKLVKDGYGKPFVALLIDADEKSVKDMTQRIRKSGSFLSLGIRIGDLRPSNDPNKVVFMFKVTDKINRPRKKTAPSE
jgi:hypothetical protein